MERPEMMLSGAPPALGEAIDRTELLALTDTREDRLLTGGGAERHSIPL